MCVLVHLLFVPLENPFSNPTADATVEKVLRLRMHTQMHTHHLRFFELEVEPRSNPSSSGIPGSHEEDLKSSQCGFDPHSGHHLSVLFKQVGPL